MACRLLCLRLLFGRMVLRIAERKIEVWRVKRYCLVGLIAFGTNITAMVLLKGHGVDTRIAAITAFFVGGQVSFWGHDRFTFGDRHDLSGWRWRWAKFMPGQFAGIAANYAAVSGLVLLNPELWLLGFDLTLALIFVGGLVCGVITTFSWTNFFSHKEKKNTKAPDQDRAPVSVES